MYNKDKVTLKKDLLKIYENIFEEALIDEIVEVGYFDKLKKGDLLIDIGDYLTHIPLILKGVIKIMRQESSGDELALYYLEPGDTCAISFANCINRKQSIYKGIVESNIEAVFIPVEVVDKWLAKYKTWRHFIIDSYHFRLLEMVESIDALAFMKMKKNISISFCTLSYFSFFPKKPFPLFRKKRKHFLTKEIYLAFFKTEKIVFLKKRGDQTLAIGIHHNR